MIACPGWQLAQAPRFVSCAARPDKDEDKGSKEAKTTKVDKGAFVAALTKSIPAKVRRSLARRVTPRYSVAQVMSDIKDWKVDQAAITKTAGSDSGSE